MKKDPINNEEFEPKNPNHFFANKGSFLKFVENNDPMEEFVPEKRQINWAPIERIDPITGVKFIADHPAQIYAPDSVNEETELANTDAEQNDDSDEITDEITDSYDSEDVNTEIGNPTDTNRLEVEEDSDSDEETVASTPPKTATKRGRASSTTSKSATASKRTTGRKPVATSKEKSLTANTSTKKAPAKTSSRAKDTATTTNNKKVSKATTSTRSSNKNNAK